MDGSFSGALHQNYGDQDDDNTDTNSDIHFVSLQQEKPDLSILTIL
jgi:hypothetical protein